MIDGEVWKNALQPLMPRGIVITKVAPAVEKVAEIETAVYAVTMPKSGLAPGYINGLSLLGGEPFEPENQRELLPFVKNVKALYPNKTIWCYTGNHFEQEILRPGCGRCEVTDEFLQYIDVLVDGDFVQDKYDISLRFRGSSNQRIIDMNRTRAAGHVVLWQDDPIFAHHKM